MKLLLGYRRNILLLGCLHAKLRRIIKKAFSFQVFFRTGSAWIWRLKLEDKREIHCLWAETTFPSRQKKRNRRRPPLQTLLNRPTPHVAGVLSTLRVINFGSLPIWPQPNQCAKKHQKAWTPSKPGLTVAKKAAWKSLAAANTRWSWSHVSRLQSLPGRHRTGDPKT